MHGTMLGYVPDGVLRLTKSDLDGACNDSRFDDDFFIDLIFVPLRSRSEAGRATGAATRHATGE